jgi:hypothetical protein
LYCPFGISYTGKTLFRANDKLTVSMKQPLRVNSGTANIAVTTIDPITGIPSIGIESVSLVPSGRESDYKVSYSTPLSKTRKMSLEAGYVKDASNIAGNSHATVGIIYSMDF